MNEILNKEIPIPKKLSVEARDFLRNVLKKNVSAASVTSIPTYFISNLTNRVLIIFVFALCITA